MFPAFRLWADAILAGIVVFSGVVFAAIRARRHDRNGARQILVLDASYTLETVRSRGLEQAILARDLGGYFEHVYSVHPLVGADQSQVGHVPHGSPRTTLFADRHTFIEGRIAQTRALRRLPLTNFALAQATLLALLTRLLSQRPVVAIRVGDPYYQGLVGLFLARRFSLPLAVRINGNYDAIYESIGRPAYPKIFRFRWIEKRIDRFVLPRTDLVIGSNRNALEFALANGARSNRSVTVPYGSLIHPIHFTDPADRPAPPREWGLGDSPYLLSIGRLEPVKHPEDVIRALSKLAPMHPELRAVLIGDGSLQEDLSVLADSIGVLERVVFAGSRDQETIARAAAGASVIVAPMAGRALVEACLSATPVVAYDTDWHAELIAPDAGVLVSFGAVDEMADAVHRLLMDPTLQQRMGEQGRRVALERMSPDRLIADERAAFEAMLAAWHT